MRIPSVASRILRCTARKTPRSLAPTMVIAAFLSAIPISCVFSCTISSTGNRGSPSSTALG